MGSMGSLWSIVLCVVLIIIVAVVFFVVDFVMRDKNKAKPKTEGKPQPTGKPKPVEEKSSVVKQEKEEKPQVSGAFNLSSDIEKLLEHDKKNDSIKKDVVRASDRSLLVSRRKMHEYYESRHRHYAGKYKGYGMEDDEHTHNHMGDIQIGDTTISGDDAKKLIALSEVLKKKSE